jgi:hypothetical protein
MKRNTSSGFHLPGGLAGLALYHLVCVFPVWHQWFVLEQGWFFLWAGIYAGVGIDLRPYYVQPESGKNNVSRYFVKRNRDNPFLMDRESP